MGIDVLYIILIIILAVILFTSPYYIEMKRHSILIEKGWTKTVVDGVSGYEKNKHFISEKRLSNMSKVSFFRRLKVGDQ